MIQESRGSIPLFNVYFTYACQKYFGKLYFIICSIGNFHHLHHWSIKTKMFISTNVSNNKVQPAGRGRFSFPSTLP